jgi:acyl carrier protein
MVSLIPTVCRIVEQHRRKRRQSLESVLNTTEPSLEDIVEAVIEFLAQLQDRDPAQLRAELEEAGQELPVDSILVVEILTRIEERYGVKIPTDAEAAHSTRSVYTFARTVLDSIEERKQP